MNWSIDAEWYDASEHLPPVLEEVLIVRRGVDCCYDNERKVFENIPVYCFAFGQYDTDGWSADGEPIEARRVVAWTWLPKLPRWLHEEND